MLVLVGACAIVLIKVDAWLLAVVLDNRLGVRCGELGPTLAANATTALAMIVISGISDRCSAVACALCGEALLGDPAGDTESAVAADPDVDGVIHTLASKLRIGDHDDCMTQSRKGNFAPTCSEAGLHPC